MECDHGGVGFRKKFPPPAEDERPPVAAAERKLARPPQQHKGEKPPGGHAFFPFPKPSPAMVALHTLFLLSLAWESRPWRVPLDLRTYACLAALLPVTFLRYWSIATLGAYWTTRIVAVPGSRVIRAGPFRWIRHPNYLVIVLEFLLLPLLLRAPFTLVAFSLANLVVLRQRIRLEERILMDHTDYGDRFA